MNPGYLTSVVIITIGILLWSGWKEVFFKELTFQAIGLFIFSWLIFSAIVFPFYFQERYMAVNAAFLFLFIFCIIRIALLKGWLERLNILTIGLLFCLLEFTFREVSGFSMVYIAIMLAFAAACFQRKLIKQLTCLLIGFLSSDLLSLFIHQRSQFIYIGNHAYQDYWWFAILLSRIFTGIYEHFIGNARRWYADFLARK